MEEFIIKYASIMFDRNLSTFGNQITKNDIINEVFTRECTTEQQVVKTVRDVVFLEKRQLMANKQRRINKELTGEKICNKCHLPKPVSDYYTRTDSRTGFRYLCNLCKECERKRHNENHRRKRQELYINTLN